MIDKVKYLFSRGIKFLLLRPSLKDCNVDKTAKTNLNSLLYNTVLGRYTYVGYNCMIVNTQVGNFCSISNNCVIGAPGHPIDWVSTSPVFIDGRNFLKKNFSNHIYKNDTITKIGNDVWIGTNCLIKPGVTIGDGAIIGMGSVVTKNVPAYEIWAGNPAKLIKKRFTEEDINLLLTIKWWEWSDEMILSKAVLFNNLKDFLDNRTNIL